MKEIMITMVIINWNARITTRDRMFGSVLDQVLLHSQLMCLVSRLVYPLNTVARIIALIPPNAEIETGFPCWIKHCRHFPGKVDRSYIFMEVSKPWSL
jgi:hypothetical protein